MRTTIFTQPYSLLKISVYFYRLGKADSKSLSGHLTNLKSLAVMLVLQETPAGFALFSVNDGKIKQAESEVSYCVLSLQQPSMIY